MNDIPNLSADEKQRMMLAKDTLYGLHMTGYKQHNTIICMHILHACHLIYSIL